MSEARDARPNMVANPYGGTTLPEIVSAAEWRPDGTEGEVMVIVPQEFQITEILRRNGYERVRFPVGTYLVPTRIRVMRRFQRGEGDEYTEREVYLEIGGLDEATMHAALQRHGVKHSALQPQLAAGPPPTSAIERFCGHCGHEKSKPHARGCPRYVPPPAAIDKIAEATDIHSRQTREAASRATTGQQSRGVAQRRSRQGRTSR